MTPEEIKSLLARLPKVMTYNYFSDRESVWLLSALMSERARVRDLRMSNLSKLLERPLIKPMMAASGGQLLRTDMAMIAEADKIRTYDGLSNAGLKGMEAVFDQPWLDFELRFDAWCHRDWSWAQMSRPGGNLVVQMGFPQDHAILLEKFLSHDHRCKFEYDAHPIRTSGRPTLAWARLDFDPSTGTVLIEELQSDWLRFVRREIRRLREQMPRSRELAATVAYEAALTERYDKLWSRALLLAVLMLARDTLGCRDVFLHQPATGAMLKSIRGALPPRSLYSSLPKSFCFSPTRDIPDLLRRKRRKDLRRLPQDAPIFWRLDLNKEGGAI